jgi:DNA-binding NarL/FixJ family response regulator
VRVAVAVQPTLFCETLTRQLGLERDLLVVGRSCVEDGLKRLLSKEKPQVLVFDYEGLGPNAESTVSRLRRAAPATRILVLASRSGDETIERVLRAGASGLAGKQLELSALVRAIRAVAAGETWANRRAASSVLEDLTRPAAALHKANLTKREQEIADACGRGLRNKEIAKTLSISEKTVKAHLNSIFRKLQVDSRFALGLRILQYIQPKT